MNDCRQHLFTGRAGTGKTSRCLKIFAEALSKYKAGGMNAPVSLILPSREHRARIVDLLIQSGETTGLAGHHLFTINDFLRFYSSREAVHAVTSIQRREIITDVLRRGQWEWLGEAPHERDGVIHALEDFIKDIKAAGCTAAQFKAASSNLAGKQSLFAKKALDLARILEVYEEALLKQQWIDPESEIHLFSEKLLKKEIEINVDTVIFDGFYSFTPAQLSFIKGLAAYAGNIYVTLTTAEGADEFLYSERVRSSLLQSGFQETGFKDALRFQNGGLKNLSQSLFSEETAKPADDAEAVQITEFASFRQELDWICCDITKRIKAGGKPMDFMIILRQISDRASLVKKVLARHGLPVEVHERLKLAEHYLGRRLKSCLDLFVYERDSGEWTLDAQQILLSANQYGIWKSLRLGRDECEWIKERFTAGESSEDTPGEVSAAASFVLDEIRKLYSLTHAAEIRNYFKEFVRLASEDLPDTRDNAMCKDLLEELIFSGCNFDDFLRCLVSLKHALETELYTSVDAGKDRNCVQVYDAVLSMPKEYPHVYVAGVSHGNFPQHHYQDPVLNDRERRQLNKWGLDLELREDRRFGEAYFFYMACTRAVKSLSVTYHRFTASGEETGASYFVKEILRTGKDLVSESAFGPEEAVTKKSLYSPEMAVRYLARRAALSGSGTTELSAKYADIYSGIGSPVRPAGRHIIPGLSERLSNFIFSASSLKSLRNCSYQFYAKKILHLKPRFEKDSEARIGSFYHKILEDTYKHFDILNKGIPPADDWIGFCEEQFEKGFAELSFDDLPAHIKSLSKEKMRQFVRSFCANEYEDVRHRQRLIPAKFEWSFGLPDSDVPALNLNSDSEAILIGGKIDRIDCSKDESLVVDYKKGEPFEYSKFKQGLVPQVPVYAEAVKTYLDKDLIGVEFVGLKENKRRGIVNKKAIKDERACLVRTKGALEKDEFLTSLKKVKEQIISDVTQIRAGSVEVNPESCSFCEYAMLCRYPHWREKL